MTDEPQDNANSSPTSTASTLTDSRSSAGIPSDLIESSSVSSEKKTTIQKSIYSGSSSVKHVHGHVLPSGWSCRYDSDNDEYRFDYQMEEKSISHSKKDCGVTAKTPTRDYTAQTSRRPTLNHFECKHGYHFPVSPTPSMISELAKQVQRTASVAASKQYTAPKTKPTTYDGSKINASHDVEEQTRRLCDMFPTAPIPIIEQMIRIYHGREGLIKAALISLGYKRSKEYGPHQSTSQSPIMLMMSKPSSKKLYDKLVRYFPDKDTALIKGLMYEHKEVEHEIISALVESKQDGTLNQAHHGRKHSDTIDYADKDGAIMKLRYLKFLYPTCEEIELYHLLNCNDLNAQRVMELVEKKGHKRINVEEVMQNRKVQIQQMRSQQAVQAAKERAAISSTDIIQAHLKETKPIISEARLNHSKDNLKETFPSLDSELIAAALRVTDCNELLAKKILQEWKPSDETIYKKRYEVPGDKEANMVTFPCKAIQVDGTNFMSIESNEKLYVPREVTESATAIALLKVDACTFTQEDFTQNKSTLRQGHKPGLAQGSSYSKTGLSPRDQNNKGSQRHLISGSKYQHYRSNRPDPKVKANNHKESLVKGRNLLLRCGHNENLLKRTHPFFMPEAKGI